MKYRHQATHVLVLNASYEPLQVVSVRHALKMIHRRVAVVEEAVPGKMAGPYKVPTVLRLVRYVHAKFRHHRPAWTRMGVLQRDAYTCGYCGRPGNTVDHIIPLSRNGTDTWENTVTACFSCNSRKGSKLLSEAGMTLRVTPRTPTSWELWNVDIPAWLNTPTAARAG